jgi:acyl CoA:acetate/3-ketoacid CoA transferase beta subunit
MNTPVEVDIYAHANSTCVMGSRMLNGLGGSADFLRSAKYSIMHTPSTRPSKTDPTGVSCIVPMCTHVDQTEHDLDIIVTEIVSYPSRQRTIPLLFQADSVAIGPGGRARHVTSRASP